MSRIIFATGNQNKMREIREIMQGFRVNGEEIEISFQYLDVTEQIGSDNGEKVIAIPVFTDGFEMNKCYPGKTEDMLCTFDELVATVVELGASGIIINALGISHYMSVKTLEAL